MSLKFKTSPRYRTKTVRLVIHHSAGADVSAAGIHQWHINQGFSGIAYHFVIRRNGALEKGRPEMTIGAHTKGYNHDSIGICLTGNFMQEKPTPAQLSTLRGLIKQLQKRYGPLPIYLHRELNATACPGTYFTRELLTQTAVISGEKNDFKHDLMHWGQVQGLTQELHSPDEPAAKWFVLTVLKNMYQKQTQT